MARKKREFKDDTFYHIVNRGVEKRDTFLDEKDYGLFMGLILKGFEKHKVYLAAHALMPNHFHLLACAPLGKEISPFMQWISGVYAQVFNKRHERTGHLWQDRFYAKQVKHGHPLGITHRYVEQNPVRANLSRSPYDWKWSSAHLRASGIQPDYLYSPRGWHRSFMKKYVNDIPLSEDELNQVRLSDPTI